MADTEGTQGETAVKRRLTHADGKTHFLDEDDEENEKWLGDPQLGQRVTEVSERKRSRTISIATENKRLIAAANGLQEKIDTLEAANENLRNQNVALNASMEEETHRLKKCREDAATEKSALKETTDREIKQLEYDLKQARSLQEDTEKANVKCEDGLANQKINIKELQASNKVLQASHDVLNADFQELKQSENAMAQKARVEAEGFDDATQRQAKKMMSLARQLETQTRENKDQLRKVQGLGQKLATADNERMAEITRRNELNERVMDMQDQQEERERSLLERIEGITQDYRDIELTNGIEAERLTKENERLQHQNDELMNELESGGFDVGPETLFDAQMMDVASDTNATDETPGAPEQQTLEQLEQQTLTSILKRCETPTKGLQRNVVNFVTERGMADTTPLANVPIDPHTSSIWLCSQAGASEDTTAVWAYLCVGFKMYFVAMTMEESAQTCNATQTWPMPVMAMYRVGIVQHTSANNFQTLVFCAAACNTLLLLAQKNLSGSRTLSATDPICGQKLDIVASDPKRSIERLCGFVGSQSTNKQDGHEALQSLITAAVESVGVVTTKEVVSRARTAFRRDHPIVALDGGPSQKHAAVPVRVGVMTPDPLGGNTNLYSMLCDSQQSSVSRSTTASLLGLAAHLVFELSLTKPKHHRNTITTMPLPSIVVGMAAADALRGRYDRIDNGRVGTLSLWPEQEGGHVGNRFVAYRPDFVFKTDEDKLVSVELKTVWRRSGEVPRTVDYQHRLQAVLQAIACGADEAVLLRVTVPYGKDLTTLRVECIRLDMSPIKEIDRGVHTKLHYNMKKWQGFVGNSGMNTGVSVDDLLELALAQTKSQLSVIDNRSWVISNHRATHKVKEESNPVMMRPFRNKTQRVDYIKGVVILASQPLSWL